MGPGTHLRRFDLRRIAQVSRQKSITIFSPKILTLMNGQIHVRCHEMCCGSDSMAACSEWHGSSARNPYMKAGGQSNRDASMKGSENTKSRHCAGVVEEGTRRA